MQCEELVEINASVSPENEEMRPEDGKSEQPYQVAYAKVLRFRAVGATSLGEASLRGPPTRPPGGAMGRTRRDLRIHQARGRASMARFLYRF